MAKITQTKIERASALLLEGMGRREVSSKTGLSRWKVDQIAAGQLKAQGRGREGRCPSCGYNVSFPCRICAARGDQ